MGDVHCVCALCFVRTCVDVYTLLCAFALPLLLCCSSLWLAFLAWQRHSHNAKGVQTTLAQALQLHPTAAVLWVAGAQFEFEEQGNVAAARVLYQRGLRYEREHY